MKIDPTNELLAWQKYALHLAHCRACGENTVHCQEGQAFRDHCFEGEFAAQPVRIVRRENWVSERWAQSPHASAPSDAEANKAISDLRRADLAKDWTASREAQDRLVAMLRRPAAPSPAFAELLRAAEAVVKKSNAKCDSSDLADHIHWLTQEVHALRTALAAAKAQGAQ